jgi:hypothetical protein
MICSFAFPFRRKVGAKKKAGKLTHVTPIGPNGVGGWTRWIRLGRSISDFR